MLENADILILDFEYLTSNVCSLGQFVFARIQIVPAAAASLKTSESGLLRDAILAALCSANIAVDSFGFLPLPAASFAAFAADFHSH